MTLFHVGMKIDEHFVPRLLFVCVAVGALVEKLIDERVI